MIKIKCFYFNERGSVLLVAIMMTSILMLLGTTASIVSVSTYKMRKVESLCKKNFQIAEALSQEADMKLDEFINESLDRSRKEVTEYIEENEDSDMDIEEKNEMFKEIFKDQLKMLKINIEDTNAYNLKIIEKHDISIELESEYLEKQEDLDAFDMSIISLFEDRDIAERIKIKYEITISELDYEDFKMDENVIRKTQWLNYKW